MSFKDYQVDEHTEVFVNFFAYRVYSVVSRGIIFFIILCGLKSTVAYFFLYLIERSRAEVLNLGYMSPWGYI